MSEHLRLRYVFEKRSMGGGYMRLIGVNHGGMLARDVTARVEFKNRDREILCASLGRYSFDAPVELNTLCRTGMILTTSKGK